MQNARNGEEFTSDTIKIGNLSFYLKYCSINKYSKSFEIHCNLSNAPNVSSIIIVHACKGKKGMEFIFKYPNSLIGTGEHTQLHSPSDKWTYPLTVFSIS